MKLYMQLRLGISAGIQIHHPSILMRWYHTPKSTHSKTLRKSWDVFPSFPEKLHRSFKATKRCRCQPDFFWHLGHFASCQTGTKTQQPTPLRCTELIAQHRRAQRNTWRYKATNQPLLPQVFCLNIQLLTNPHGCLSHIYGISTYIWLNQIYVKCRQIFHTLSIWAS